MKLVIILFLLVAPAHVYAYEKYRHIVTYDRYFSKYSKRFFGPGFDWRYFKAQAIAESNLNPHAVSRFGATGIMQIMPKTYAEITRQNPRLKGSIKHPHWNIAAGIYYNRQMWKIWTSERPWRDRISFMLGSFNAGKDTILRAQRIAKKKGLSENLWRSIEQTLPRVTGRRSKETIGYVRKVHKIREVLR